MGRLLGTRAREATTGALVASGALPGMVDGGVVERGWRRLGEPVMSLPIQTLEKSRALSVHLYRTHPLAKAIIDTLTAFGVGDSGVSVQASDPKVARFAQSFYNAPRNGFVSSAQLFMRDHLLMGETVWETLVTAPVARVEICPRSPNAIRSVTLEGGNPLWPAQLVLPSTSGDDRAFNVVRVPADGALRDGEVLFFRSGQALATDVRGAPFLLSVIDQLESFDLVQSNLIDRTALARYFAWDVTVDGGQPEVDAFLAARGGQQAPASGSVEVHSQGVKWEAKTVSTGAMEDSQTLSGILTMIAAGPGLAKTWLAEPEGANRATSVSMAEPVRRRVGAVQQAWVGCLQEAVRFAVDRAVAVGVLDAMVLGADGVLIPAAESVSVHGPEIAAADAQVNATVLYNLAQALDGLVSGGVLSVEAARVAAQKAWEQFTGEPWRSDLAPALDAASSVDALASALAEAERRMVRA